MSTVAVLLVAGPLLVGAVLAAVGVTRRGRALGDPVAMAVAVAVCAGAGWAALHAGRDTVVLWPGGWSPVDGTARGIALVIDLPASLTVLLVGLLTVAALMFSWHFFDESGGAYDVLVLVFLGSCAGFVLAGDLFDAFVWFELMGVAAYALTGLRVEEPRSIHGALSFGIVNTLGASLSLVGITLLYAHTGELNLAAVGEALQGSPGGPVVPVSCALLLTGVLVKMALVPFHFWTADAEAVAPTPVCVLLSGAMVSIAGYAVARWWWVVFDGTAIGGTLRPALVGFGAVTAVVGAVMCLGQRHVKRLLAYSTVAHAGVLACAIGTLTAPGVAAAGTYAVGHAGTKGALFLVTGLLLNRFGSVDEHELFGQGTGMRVAGGCFVLGGLALAGLPGLGTWSGKAALSHAAGEAHLPCLELVVLVVSVLTGGAVLRAGLRIFAGLGERPAPEGEIEEQPEVSGGPRPGSPRVVVPPVVLLLLTAVPALGPGAGQVAAAAGEVLTHRSGYAGAVLAGTASPPHVPAPEPLWSPLSVATGLVGVLLALGVAAAALWGPRLPRLARRALAAARTGMRALHSVHRAHVGDYVSWLLVGFAVLGAALLLS